MKTGKWTSRFCFENTVNMMQTKISVNHKRVKYACYVTNISQALVCNLSPLLFITFHTMYGISYAMLGLLVSLGFVTQLAIDLIFSFFSHKFNIPLTVKITPLLTFAGLLVYALFPLLFPGQIYVGLVVGSLIFSASGGLAEVLISPTIAALPSENPDHEMSLLHAIYAWGVVFVVILSTLFLLWQGNAAWQVLTLLLALIPLIAFFLFLGAKLPPLQTEEKGSGATVLIKEKGLWLCVLAIFLGGASECTMSQWCSGYLEQAVGIPKVWGDIFGVALFGLMLGLGRTLYAKRGRYIGRVLLLGAIGALLCYLTAALSPFPLLGLFACAFTGFCVSMLWPGSLIVSSSRFPQGGVFIYAMMAAGGDFGGAVGPQLIGIVTDAVAAAPWALSLAEKWQLAPEQLGMKVGMLVGMLFPLAAIFVYLSIWRTQKRHAASAAEKLL